MVGIIYAIAMVFFVLWVLGLVFAHAGGIIHILLVLAIIAVVYNVLTGRRAI